VKRVENVFIGIIISVIFFLFVASIINLQYGIDSLGIMEVFSADEASTVAKLHKNLAIDKVDPEGFYNYGYFYQTIVFYISKIFKAVGYNTDIRFIGFVFRLISFLSMALILLLTYKIMKLFESGSVVTMFTLLFMISIPKFYYWSQMVHPDILQSLLIVFAVYIALREHRILNVMAASFISGVAFGTKYSGIFILPFLVFPYMLSLIGSGQALLKKNLLKLGFVVLGMLGLFLLAFLITNPTVINNYDALYSDISFEKLHVATGHGRTALKDPFLWFSVIHTQLSSTDEIILIFGMIFLIYSIIKGRSDLKGFFSSSKNRAITMLFSYSFLSFLYIMVAVNMRKPRYLFHIFPFVVMLAFLGIAKLEKVIEKKHIYRVILFTVLTIYIVPNSIYAVKLMSVSTNKYEHQFVKATEWIKNNYKHNTPVLADLYSYRHPTFTNFRTVFGVNPGDTYKYQPTLIMLNRTLSGRWSWKKTNTKFNDLDFIYGWTDAKDAKMVGNFHLKLFSSDSPYKVVYETSDVVILQRVEKNNKIPRF